METRERRRGKKTEVTKGKWRYVSARTRQHFFAWSPLQNGCRWTKTLLLFGNGFHVPLCRYSSLFGHFPSSLSRLIIVAGCLPSWTFYSSWYSFISFFSLVGGWEMPFVYSLIHLILLYSNPPHILFTFHTLYSDYFHKKKERTSLPSMLWLLTSTCYCLS